MRHRAPAYDRRYRQQRGDTSRRAGGNLKIRDDAGNSAVAQGFVVGSFSELEDEDEVYINGFASLVKHFTNSAGTTLALGTVVVIQADGTVTTTTTPQDTRPVGVVAVETEDGELAPVTLVGYVEQINTNAAVTAGNYAETSAVAGEAAESATRRIGSFAQFLSTGTTPSGYLFGVSDSAGSGIGGAEAPFDHGAMGATETIDLADGTWHRGTLTADCTITVTGFAADEGLVAVVELLQDGTGGWDITWDADVQFVGEDQPDLAANAVTVFLLFSSLGDTAIFGARVGGGGPGVTYGTPAIVLGTAAAAGATDEAIRRDATIVAFDATAPSTQAFGDAAAVGVAAVAARRDHKHAIPANPVTAAAVQAVGRWEPVTQPGQVFVWDGDEIVVQFVETP